MKSHLCRLAEYADIDFFAIGKAARHAKNLCNQCPVQPECLTKHLDVEYGVFGGMTGRERKKERSRRGIMATRIDSYTLVGLTSPSSQSKE